MWHCKFDRRRAAIRTLFNKPHTSVRLTGVGGHNPTVKVRPRDRHRVFMIQSREITVIMWPVCTMSSVFRPHIVWFATLFYALQGVEIGLPKCVHFHVSRSTRRLLYALYNISLRIIFKYKNASIV
jgi:hypothetical protein